MCVFKGVLLFSKVQEVTKSTINTEVRTIEKHIK